MAKMHYCTARINLAGQSFHIVHILPSDPISWPEAQVLMMIHGEENVMDVKPCGVADVNPVDEKRRLLGKYASNAKAVEATFPGRTFRMELLMPAEDDHQPRLDADGAAIATMPDDGDSKGPSDPPMDAPVFKPGRHRPEKQPEA